MTCINLTETGLLALVSIGVGFVLSFCKLTEQSRCKNIKICYGLLACERTPYTVNEILKMDDLESVTENKEDV